MKLDRDHKAEKLGTRIPGFVGYGSIHHRETDRQLRRFLATGVGQVCDRLADFIAAGTHPEELRQKLGFSLRAAALLKEEITPPAAERQRGREPEAALEERLLDFDLVLLDKIAALPSLLDRMEGAEGAEALVHALASFNEGLAEVRAVFQERHRILQATQPGDSLQKQ